MRSTIFAIAAVLAAVSVAVPADAAPCRNGNGEFVACPKAASATPARCKDARSEFAKCRMPGARLA